MHDDKTACTAETDGSCRCDVGDVRCASIDTDRLNRAVRMQPETAVGVISFWLGLGE